MAFYTILPVKTGDIGVVTRLVVDGLLQDGYQEFVRATWPGLDTPKGRSDAEARFSGLRKHLAEPNHFLKVVEESSGAVVATSISFYNPEPPKALPGLSGDSWASQEDKEYAERIRRERNAMLLRIFGEMEGAVTEIMAFFVEASRQRQGIGKVLMDYLLAMDAQRGRPIVLIANPKSVEFYLKQGFEIVEDLLLPLPEKWEGKPRSHLVSMVKKT